MQYLAVGEASARDSYNELWYSNSKESDGMRMVVPDESQDHGGRAKRGKCLPVARSVMQRCLCEIRWTGRLGSLRGNYLDEVRDRSTYKRYTWSLAKRCFVDGKSR